MSLKRATRFLKKTLLISLIIISVIVILALVEAMFHPFARYIGEARAWIARTEAVLSRDSFLGISFGMIVLTFCVVLFPMLLPKVNKKQYRTNTFRGVVATIVFFFTELIYTWAEHLGRLHLLAAMLIAIIVTMIVIEFLSLLTRVDEEVAFRTDLLAAAASGLASGIVLKLISVLFAK